METETQKEYNVSELAGWLVERQQALGEQLDVTDEHAAILRAINDGQNVFVTGGAGTGKTTFVGEILVPWLDSWGAVFSIVASTGIAASHHPGGRTWHSWSGAGLGPNWNNRDPLALSDEDVRRVYHTTYDAWQHNPRGARARAGVSRRIRSCRVLIVDEVSMFAGVGFLGYLDFLYRMIRDNDKPFGGIQMVFVGDNCQLPPVDKTDGRIDWAFRSPAWQWAGVRPYALTRVFRQADPVFIGILNKTRLGSTDFTDNEVLALQSRLIQPDPQRKWSQTHLVATNSEADRINADALDHFPGETLRLDAYTVVDKHHLRGDWDSPEKIRQELMRNHSIRPTVFIKPGMPVLMTLNDPEQRFVNGTKATFMAVRRKDNGQITHVTVRLPSGEEVEMGRQRKALSAHADPYDQVTLTEEGGMRVVNRYPLVCQFPIVAATAITVHRSQGMSLDECVIDLSRTFAPGHVYVAVSRLRTLEGLYLTSNRFDPQVDPEAAAYHSTIEPQRWDFHREATQPQTR